MWNRYARIHHPLFVGLPVSTFRQCVAKAPQKQQPKEQPIKQRYFPVLIGAGLLVSGNIITGLANAGMDDASHKRGKFMANKLDVNNDGTIDKTEFDSRIVTMFEKMDSNGEGSLDDKKINKMKHHHSGKVKNKTGEYSN